MATQSIEVKDFTGGRNFLTSPFNVYPTEAEIFTNIALDSTGMRTANYIPVQKLLPARGSNAYQVAPKEGEAYTLSHATESVTEKVRHFQGSEYIINAGIPYKLNGAGKLASTVVANTIVGHAVQTAHTAPADGVKIKAVNYIYYMSTYSAAGFESPLEEIGHSVGHKTWDTNFTVELASDQVITLDKLPATGDYVRIYRMGDNISQPALVCQIDSAGIITLHRGPISWDNTKKELTFALLDDLLGIFARTWGAVYPGDLRYLAATKYGLAAAKGSQLYLSMGRPDAWSELTMLNFGSTITGVASVYRGILVFTESTYLYLITGADPFNLDVNVVSTDIGCASNSSLSEIGHKALIWVYNRRFYVFSGSKVEELEANTYDFDFFARQGFSEEVTAVSGQNKYLVGDDNGLVMVDMNHRYNPFIDYNLMPQFIANHKPAYLRDVLTKGHKTIGAYHHDGSFYVLHREVYGDVEYVDKYPETDDFEIGCYTSPPTPEDWDCVTDTSKECPDPYVGLYGPETPIEPTACFVGAVVGRYNIHTLDIVPVMTDAEYKSPMFTFGDMNAPIIFTSVEVLFEGELDVFVYIDDVEVRTKVEFVSQRRGTARIVLPSKQAQGNFLQVKLRFNGAVYGYRVMGDPLYSASK